MTLRRTSVSCHNRLHLTLYSLAITTTKIVYANSTEALPPHKQSAITLTPSQPAPPPHSNISFQVILYYHFLIPFTRFVEPFE